MRVSSESAHVDNYSCDSMTDPHAMRDAALVWACSNERRWSVQSRSYLSRGLLAGLSSSAGAMLGCLAGLWLGAVYTRVMMPGAELEGVIPPFIGSGIGTIIGMVVGIAGVPPLIRHLGIRWGVGLLLVLVLLGSILFHLYHGLGGFTFVLVGAASLGLLGDLLRWDAWPLR